MRAVIADDGTPFSFFAHLQLNCSTDRCLVKAACHHWLFKSIPRAAVLLGASPWRVWREVDLPIVARAVLVGAVFAFTVSMGEFGATSLIARPERPTMPVAIYRFLGRPGATNYGQALAMSTLLMAVCTVRIVLHLAS